LLARISKSQKDIEEAGKTVPTAKALALRKAKARTKTKALEASFKKYDRDNDKELNEKEIIAYAKGEFKYSLSKAQVATLLSNMLEKGEKGVQFESFNLLKIAIGAIREEERDVDRQKYKLELQQVMKDLQASLRKRIGEVSKVIDEAEKEVKKAEEKVNPLFGNIKSLGETEIEQIADRTTLAVRKAKEKADSAREARENLSRGLDERFAADMKVFVKKESKLLTIKTRLQDKRVARALVLCDKFRSRAAEKRESELRNLRLQALSVIQYNQRLGRLQAEELFELIHGGEQDGEILEEEFLRFFRDADHDVQELTPEDIGEPVVEEEEAVEEPEEIPEEEEYEMVPDGEQPEEGEAAANGDEDTPLNDWVNALEHDWQEDAPPVKGQVVAPPSKVKAVEEAPSAWPTFRVAKPSSKKQAKPPQLKPERIQNDPVVLSEDQLKMVYARLHEESEYGIPKEKFLAMIRRFMKVTKATTITNAFGIRDSKTLRRLEKNEVVEVLFGPFNEVVAGVQRVQVRTVYGEDGWATVKGNQGTRFLDECGPAYKVVKPALLTEEFELEEGKNADDILTIKTDPSAPSCKAGDVLDVLEWPKQDVNSGLIRLKGMVQGDKARKSGWVSVANFEGVPYLLPM